MDTFVFAVGTKKAMARLQKEMQDLVNMLRNSATSWMQAQLAILTHWCVLLPLQSEFCGDKPKSGAKYGLPDSLAILSEMGEVTDGVMDNKVKYSDDVIQNSSGMIVIPDPN